MALVFQSVISRFDIKSVGLTLPALKRRGFLVHRRALKLSILVAILKPDTRSIEQSAESNLNNPSGLHLPKRQRIVSLVPVCPTVLCTINK
jgi:hypothetical protein